MYVGFSLGTIQNKEHRYLNALKKQKNIVLGGLLPRVARELA